jgi:hypothetical protein
MTKAAAVDFSLRLSNGQPSQVVAGFGRVMEESEVNIETFGMGI